MNSISRQFSKINTRRGAITMFAAICLVVVVAFLAFSIDLGYISVTEAELQNAADSSALSGARMLDSGDAAAINAAVDWGGRNRANGRNVQVDGSLDVEVGTWDNGTATFKALPPGSGVPNAVKVTCKKIKSRGNQLNLFFGPLMGVRDTELQATAIATGKSDACGSIIALDHIYLNTRSVFPPTFTDSYDTTKGFYPGFLGSHGDVCSNGHVTLNNGSTVNGDVRYLKGSKTPNIASPSTQVTGSITTFDNPIQFPGIDTHGAETANDNGLLGLSDNGVPVLIGNSFQLGVISGTADSVALNPGVYYFSDFSLANGSTVFVTGPTYIYIGGPAYLTGGQINNVTQVPMNLQIYPMGSEIWLPTQGNMHAVIYSTTSDIRLDSSGSNTLEFFGKMIGSLIRIWDARIHVDESIKFSDLRSGGAQIGHSEIMLVQ